MQLDRITSKNNRIKKGVALVLSLSLLCTPVVWVGADSKAKSTSKKADAKQKEASVYNVKTNSVNIKLKGYKNRQDIVLKIYEKQEDGQYRLIKKITKSDMDKDEFKFLETINEKSVFDYGKTYKYVITSKQHFTEKKKINDVIGKDFNNSLGTKAEVVKHKNRVLSDGEKNSFKNYGKVYYFKNKNYKTQKTFKTISKQKRLLEFSKKFKKVVYSQAKRNQKGFADCSSFVYALYKDIGMNMGGEGANTETELAWCEKNALKVKLSSAKLGDVIFYSDEDEDTFEDHYKHVTHVAIFKDNKTIMEMSGVGVNFRTRAVSARDSDCIAVYRPIFDSKDLVDKDNHKQNLKKSKKDKDKKLKKKSLSKRKADKKSKKKNTKQTEATTKESEYDLIEVEEETTTSGSIE